MKKNNTITLPREVVEQALEAFSCLLTYNTSNAEYAAGRLAIKSLQAALRPAMIKLNTDKSAAVNQQLVWLSIDDHPPPVGAKLLLINRANGVAVLGTYQAKHQWTHWQGLPKFSEEQQ